MQQHLSVEAIKASVQIEDIVRRRGVVLRANQSGERLEGHCPFHAFDETPSFNMYVSVSAIIALAVEPMAT